MEATRHRTQFLTYIMLNGAQQLLTVWCDTSVAERGSLHRHIPQPITTHNTILRTPSLAPRPPRALSCSLAPIIIACCPGVLGWTTTQQTDSIAHDNIRQHNTPHAILSQYATLSHSLFRLAHLRNAGTASWSLAVESITSYRTHS